MIPKEIIETAKKADLPNVVQQLGIELIPNGSGYHLREHDSLKLFRINGIWLYKWWSQGGEAGDGIQFLQRYLGMEFPKAVETLSGIPIACCKPHDQNLWQTKKWQTASKKLIDVAVSYLLGPDGKERFLYLVENRGLCPRTILKHRLGWLPHKDHMPSKLLIPCYNSQGTLMRIRFRIDKPNEVHQRYRISKGSNPHAPFPLGICRGKPLIIVESELDAILIAQDAGDLIGVLGLGSTSNELSSEMICYLNAKIPVTMISLDNDDSGKSRTTKLLDKLSNSISWPIPEKYGKDPGEAWQQMSIRAWIEKGITARNSSDSM